MQREERARARALEQDESQVDSLRREIERLRLLAGHDHDLAEAVLHQSPHGVVVFDAKGRLVLQNDAARRIWAGGASANSVDARGKYRAFHPDGRPFERGDWATTRCLASGTAVEAEEVHFQRFDDSHGTLLGSCAPLRDPDGALTGAVSVFADISRFKELEHATEEAHRRASFLVTTGTLLLSATLDPNETLRRIANAAVPSVAELALVELFDGTARGGQPAAVAHVDANKIEAVRRLRAKFPHDRESGTGFVLRTGEALLISSTSAHALPCEFEPWASELGVQSVLCVPMTARGRVIGAITLASTSRSYGVADRAMTEQLGLQAGLALENGRLYREASLLYALVEAVNRASTLEEVYQPALDALAQALDVERSSILLFDPDGVMRFKAWRGLSDTYRAAVEGHTPWTRETTDAEPIVVADVAADPSLTDYLPVFGAEGIRGLVFLPIAHQSTLLGKFMLYSREPRELSLDELRVGRTIAAEVAQAVARKRSEAELKRLVREAEAANRTKDEFLAVVSHELRTPLSAIVGWATLLKTTARRSDEQTLTKGLLVIERNANMQARIIDDILDVSRIITGKLVISPRPVSATYLVNEALDSVRASAAAKNIAVGFRHGSEPYAVVGDPDRLRQVIWNLLSNAIKFTPGRGEIDIELRRELGSVVLSVRDSGDGIAPELLPFVFERFRQGDATTTRRHGGLGLGLAIVRHLVELHGGQVNAESDGPGKGATFTLKFPVRAVFSVTEATTSLAARPARTAGGTARASTDLRDVRVLVVDDEPDARDLLGEVLVAVGATVQLADSASRARELLPTFRPHVIVSDIGMPEEDGYSLVRGLRSSSGPLARTPAIALTAYARSEDVQRALDAGFQAHVSKPADPAVLVRAIADARSALADG
jgi:signal transduction histidine kinase/ActR/RegA family two-component response regulator